MFSFTYPSIIIASSVVSPSSLGLVKKKTMKQAIIATVSICILKNIIMVFVTEIMETTHLRPQLYGLR